jgi:predicted nucleic acid-binding protein
MPPILILDTGVLSNCVLPISQPAGGTLSTSQQCRQWLAACERNGANVLVPAIAYYETLREIERRKATAQRTRLIEYCFQPDRFLPLTTAHLESAAALWAQLRNTGSQTASDAALDGDTILCAQVQSLGLSAADYVVATTNTKHLVHFVNAEEWQRITP